MLAGLRKTLEIVAQVWRIIAHSLLMTLSENWNPHEDIEYFKLFVDQNLVISHCETFSKKAGITQNL